MNGLPLQLLSGVNDQKDIRTLFQGFLKNYIPAVNHAGRKKAFYRFLQSVNKELSSAEHPYYKETAQYLLQHWDNLQAALLQSVFVEQKYINSGAIPHERPLYGQMWMILYRVEGMNDKEVDKFTLRTLSAWNLLPEKGLSGMFDWLIGEKSEDGNRYGGMFGKNDYYQENGQSRMGDLFSGQFYDTYGTTRAGNMLDAINPFSDGVTRDGDTRLNPFATTNWDKMSLDQQAISLNNNMNNFSFSETEDNDWLLDDEIEMFAFDDGGNITGSYMYNSQTGKQGGTTDWGAVTQTALGVGGGIAQTLLTINGEQDKLETTKKIYGNLTEAQQNAQNGGNVDSGKLIYDTMGLMAPMLGNNKNGNNHQTPVIMTLPQGATQQSDGSVRLADGTVLTQQQAQQQYGRPNYTDTTKNNINSTLLYGGIGLACCLGIFMLGKNKKGKNETGLKGVKRTRKKGRKNFQPLGFVPLQ